MYRVAIFAINYWPEPTGAALNTTGLATGLTRCGWDVSVVTGVPHYPSWRPARAPVAERSEGVRIRRYAHYVPRTQTAPRRALYEATWYLSALRGIAWIGKPDVVLGVSPSLGGAALARTASFVLGRPYSVLFQDLIGRAASQSGIPGGALVAGPVAHVERWLARDAAAVMIVAEGFRDHFERDRRDARIVRVRNPVRLSDPTVDRASARAALGWRADETIVLHTGSMGFKQGLDAVLDAAALANGSDIRFVLQGDGSLRPALERAVAARALRGVTFRPLDPPEALPNTLAAADVLLLHQRAGVRNMSLPAKLGTYMAAGRPIVAAVGSDDEVAREIGASGAGILVPPGDPRALLEAIRRLRADPARAADLGARGREFARRELSPGAAVDAIGSTLAAVAHEVGSGR